MEFLYDILLQEFGKRAIAQVTVPNHITDNLKPGFGQRPYQIEAFQRFSFLEWSVVFSPLSAFDSVISAFCFPNFCFSVF